MVLVARDNVKIARTVVKKKMAEEDEDRLNWS